MSGCADNAGERKAPPKAAFVGLATVDLVYFLEDIPPRNAKVSVAKQYIHAGGPAANAAITFAFLGGSATLLTAVGRHPLASVIHADLSAFSVSVQDMACEQHLPPPVSSIMVVQETGERTVVSANAKAFPPLRYEPDAEMLNGISIVLVDGHYMQTCIAIAQLAHSRGIPVVLDSGSWKQGMEALLSHVEIAICSDDFRPPGCQTYADALRFLIAQGIPKAAITRGAAPICYADGGQTGEIPIDQVRALNTLGAGDIFHGAFCFSASQPDRTFPQSLAFAARIASYSCQFPGTREWMQAFPRSEIAPA